MATVFTLAGTFGSPQSPEPLFRGDIVRNNTVVPIIYQNWGIDDWRMEQGADILDGQLHAHTPPFVVLGFSMGARTVNLWLRNHGPTSSIDPADIKFIMGGDSTRKYGGVLYDAAKNGAPDDTPYDVVDFAAQYDGWADWPADIWNLVALQNATTGASVVHGGGYFNVSIEDSRNVTYRDTVNGSPGNIKYVFSPTYPLPMLAGWAWWPEFQRQQDAALRPVVEAAYNRPVLLDLLSPEVSGSRRAELSLIEDRVERERNYRG